jgi:hypothetical protein
VRVRHRRCHAKGGGPAGVPSVGGYPHAGSRNSRTRSRVFFGTGR